MYVCVCVRYMNIKLYFYLFPFLLPTVCRSAPAARLDIRRSRRRRHRLCRRRPLLRSMPAAATTFLVAPRRSAHIKQNLLENISFSLSLSHARSYSHFLSFSFALSRLLSFATRRRRCHAPQLVLTVTPTQAAPSLSPSLSLCYFIFYFAFCMLIRNCCCNCFHCYARSLSLNKKK